MNRALDQVTVRRDLPPVFEVFRAASGIVAIAALVGLLTATILIGESDAPLESTLVLPGIDQAGGVEPANQSAPDWLPAQPALRVLVFYLVSTPAQEAVADWGEQVGAMEAGNLLQPDREYRILYARDPEEEQFAGQAMLDAVGALGDMTLVQVIDLRSVSAGEM